MLHRIDSTCLMRNQTVEFASAGLDIAPEQRDAAQNRDREPQRPQHEDDQRQNAAPHGDFRRAIEQAGIVANEIDRRSELLARCRQKPS